MKGMAFYLDKIILLIISIFILVVPYSGHISKRCFYLAVFLWIVKSLLDYKNKTFKRLPALENVDKVLLAFFCVAVLAALFGLNPYHSQGVLFERYIVYILIYFLGVSICEKKKNIFFLTGVLFAMSIILAVGGLHDYLLMRLNRLFTVFGKGLELPFYLIIVIPIIFSMGLFFKNKIWKIISLIITGGLFLNLVFSGSRGALIAVVISFIAVVGFLKIRKTKKILIFIPIVLVLLFMPNMSSRLKDKGSIVERGRLFSSSISIFKDYPVLGAGPGMYEKLLYKYQPLGGYADGGGHSHAHNTYLEVAAEMGIVGLIAFLGIFVVYFRKIFKSLKFIKDNNILAIQIGLLGAIIANLIQALSCTIITVGVQNSALFWLLLGISGGIVRNTFGEEGEKEEDGGGRTETDGYRNENLKKMSEVRKRETENTYRSNGVAT